MQYYYYSDYICVLNNETVLSNVTYMSETSTKLFEQCLGKRESIQSDGRQQTLTFQDLQPLRSASRSHTPESR